MQPQGRRLATVIAALALTAGAAIASKPVKTTLTATGAVAHARGQARLQLKTDSRGKFQVVAQRLARSTSYDVVVDGVKVATLVTTGGGGGKVKFSTSPKGRDLFLGFDPRGAQVSLRDAAGDDVLETEFPTGGTPDDAGKVACCLPDDSGTECEDRTPDQCAAQGGTVAGVDSCLPDPCAGVTPPGGEDEVLCCLPDSASGAIVDDSPEVECEDVTVAACAAAGGTVLEGTSCDPNPCAPVPPAVTVVCCVPDDSGPECEVRTPEHCAARGGTEVAATSCAADPCAGMTGGGSTTTTLVDDGGTTTTTLFDDHGGARSRRGGRGGHDDPAGHR